MTCAGTSPSTLRPDSPAPRFGCCGSMVATTADSVGAEFVGLAAELGFDYVELSLRDLVALEPSARADLERRLARADLGCEACNNFFPPEVRLTGPAADPAVARRYADQALALAAALGAAVVVFGSSGARNFPAGFSPAAARRQLLDLLLALGPIAERHRITIAIEHLCRAESNILNSLAECRHLADEVAHPHVRLLADAYHARCENEAPGGVTALGSRIAHVHVAEGEGRRFPAGGDATLRRFFHELSTVGYAGRISIEAFTQDFPADARRGLPACRAYWGGA